MLEIYLPLPPRPPIRLKCWVQLDLLFAGFTGYPVSSGKPALTYKSQKPKTSPSLLCSHHPHSDINNPRLPLFPGHYGTAGL